MLAAMAKGRRDGRDRPCVGWGDHRAPLRLELCGLDDQQHPDESRSHANVDSRRGSRHGDPGLLGPSGGVVNPCPLAHLECCTPPSGVPTTCPPKIVAYSSWSRKRIRRPPTTTTVAVAVTMTLAAVRTEGGSRRNRDIRRSTGFGGAIRGMAGSWIDGFGSAAAGGSAAMVSSPCAASHAFKGEGREDKA
jgi:hypothetical protein